MLQVWQMMMALLHPNGQLRSERDGDTEKGCQKPAVQQKMMLLIVVNFLFFYSILRWSVAVSTMRRQSSRIAAFLQADARLMFCWPRSASTAPSQVWLGLPDGRFQSGGSPRITAATARWWSSWGELRVLCPKSRKRLSVTRWERGRHPVVALTSTFVTWRVYGIVGILHKAHMYVKCINARALELCCGPCFAPIQQDRDYVCLVEAYFGIQPDA